MPDPSDYTSDEILESYVRLNELRWGGDDDDDEDLDDIELEEYIWDEE